MAAIPRDKVDEVKRRADIVEIAGALTPLRRVGRQMKGCCPFHEESTPSFSVDAGKGVWHCFGCGAGGDVVSLVMRSRGCTFEEAVRDLAGWYGVDLGESRAASVPLQREYGRGQLVAIAVDPALVRGEAGVPMADGGRAVVGARGARYWWVEAPKGCTCIDVDGSSVDLSGATARAEAQDVRRDRETGAAQLRIPSFYKLTFRRPDGRGGWEKVGTCSTLALERAFELARAGRSASASRDVKVRLRLPAALVRGNGGRTLDKGASPYHTHDLGDGSRRCYYVAMPPGTVMTDADGRELDLSGCTMQAESKAVMLAGDGAEAVVSLDPSLYVKIRRWDPDAEREVGGKVRRGAWRAVRSVPPRLVAEAVARALAPPQERRPDPAALSAQARAAARPASPSPRRPQDGIPRRTK